MNNPTKLRIGLVTGEYPPMEGGIGAHCRELAAALSDAGHTVAIFTDPRGQSSDDRVQVTHLDGRWNRRGLRAIDAWARAEHLDVVNLHFQTAAYQMSPWVHWLPGLVKSAPVVTTFHDLRFPYLFPKAGPLRTWIVRRLARASAGVIATNHEDFARLTHLPHAALIPIGSSVQPHLPPDFDRDTWRANAGASSAETLVAHFGFINHSKGVEVLLEALTLLIRAGMPLRLLMIGGRTGSSDPTNAAYVESIDHLIDLFGLTAYVRWTGFVDDPTASAYFAAADLVVLPFLDGASYRRSSLMAAIAHETAILTTKPAVPVPTFQNGDNLLLVSPGNVRALAAAIQVAGRSPDLRDRLHDGARLLKHEFDWTTIARANADCFAQVIAAWRTGRGQRLLR